MTQGRRPGWRTSAIAILIFAGSTLVATACGASTSAPIARTTAQGAQPITISCQAAESRVNQVLSSVSPGSPKAELCMLSRPDVCKQRSPVCVTSDAIRDHAAEAIGRLSPTDRAALYRLGHVQRTDAANDQQAAALAIAAGFVRGAAGRAIPTSTDVTPAELSSALGPRIPSPWLADAVQAAIDNSQDPPCDPPGAEPTGASSGLAEAGVEAVLETLAKGGSLDQVVGVVLTKMFAAKICDEFRRLSEALQRAAALLTKSALRDRIVMAQAELEHIDLPPKDTPEYRQLRQRAVRGYVLHGAVSELESQSGGAIATDVSVRVGTLNRPGGPTDTALKDALADGQLDPVAER